MLKWVGVYVPISNEIMPNPYLKIPGRDILTVAGEELTLINPAFMTRMISELASENLDIYFHLTSLDPIRPENKAMEWEKQALYLFETGQKEYFFKVSSEDRFYYMAPLLTGESCLTCHAEQGYQIGDIRGGISVSFFNLIQKFCGNSYKPFNHWLSWAVLIAYFGQKVIISIGKLEQQTEIDGLTQINNRHFFSSYYKREFNRAKEVEQFYP